MLQKIYKIIPKWIKKHIENDDYRKFLELSSEERKRRLKTNKFIYFVIIQYCYIFCLLNIFFEVKKFSGWAGVPPEKIKKH